MGEERAKISATEPYVVWEHLLADALTFCNLACGTAAVLLPGDDQTVRRSTLMLVGALCDTLDGPLARHSGNPTEFGAAADGVSDVITFGIAPAAALAKRRQRRQSLLAKLAPGFYLVTAAWRVARYGIGPRKSHVFRGLPVTGAGIIFALACQAKLPPRALTFLAIALGIAMVSPMRVLSGEAMVRRDLQSLSIP